MSGLLLLLIFFSAQSNAAPLTQSFCEALLAQTDPGRKTVGTAPNPMLAYRAIYLSPKAFEAIRKSGLSSAWIFLQAKLVSAEMFEQAWYATSLENEVDKKYSWNIDGNHRNLLVSFSRYPELAAAIAAGFFVNIAPPGSMVYIFEVQLDPANTIFPSQVASKRLQMLKEIRPALILRQGEEKWVFPIDDNFEVWSLGKIDPHNIRRVFRMDPSLVPKFVPPQNALPQILPADSQLFLSSGVLL